MRITDVEAIPLVRKLNSPFEGGSFRVTNRYTIVTRITTADGTMGETFGGDEDMHQTKIIDIINNRLKPVLVGESVLNYERLWEKMFQVTKTLDLGNRGFHYLDMVNRAIIMESISAVDIAIWDTLGKVLNQSVNSLLGGYRNDVPVITIGGYYQKGKTLDDLAREMVGYQSSGFKGVKMKVGRLDLESDVERVRVVRRAVGDDFAIICDANQAWTVADAIKFGKLVRDFRINWLEEPVMGYDQYRGLNAVRSATGIPITAGQGEISRYGCRDLIAAGSVDILNTDVTLVGGVTEWRKVADVADAYLISMAHHEEPQVSLQLLSAIPHGLFLEIFADPSRDPLWAELLSKAPAMKDGMMQVPDEPGFGLKLEESVITKYRAT